MKRNIQSMLCALALTATLLGLTGFRPPVEKPEKPIPAPVIVRFQAHSAHANDFIVRRSKDRGLESEIRNKGLDVAYTDWMRRDHPYVFASECIKDAGKIATAFKSTNHMVDFDKLIEKRADLRQSATRLGHDVAFADWLRTEHPDVYRQHFGLDAHNRPIKPESKTTDKDTSKTTDKDENKTNL